MNATEASRRLRILGTALSVAWALTACGAPTHIDRRFALDSGATVKVFNAAGSVRLVGWDRDSLAIKATMGRGERFFVIGDHRGLKLGTLDPVAERSRDSSIFELRVPRSARVSVKTGDGAIAGRDVSGWFYAIAGAVSLEGIAREVQVETVSGSVSIEVQAPWVRLRTASGRVNAIGEVADLGIASVTGPVIVDAASRRGRVETMSGSIAVNAAKLFAGATLDVDSHNGPIEVTLPMNRDVIVETRTVDGRIEGAGKKAIGISRDAPHITAATFNGTIRIIKR